MYQQTYYLSSLESKIFSTTRKCVFVKTLSFDSGKECILAKITPGINGQNFGSPKDIEFVVLAARHEGDSLSSITEFPCFIFVARSLDSDITTRSTIKKSDLQILAWGELYKTKDDADGHVFD